MVTSMSAIMTDVNAILTGMLTGASSVVTTIMAEGNTLIRFVLLFGFAYGIIKVVRKLMGV